MNKPAKEYESVKLDKTIVEKLRSLKRIGQSFNGFVTELIQTYEAKNNVDR